jgi:hypothetical protein
MISYNQKSLTPAQQEKVCEFVAVNMDAVKIIDDMFYDSLSNTDGTNGGDLKIRYGLVSDLKRLIAYLDPDQIAHL